MLPEWFDTARADAERRGLGHIVPVLEALRASGDRLRQAAWAEHATARIALRGAALAPAAIAPPPPDTGAVPASATGAPDHRRDRRQAPFGRRLGVVAGRGGPRRHRPRQPAAERVHHGHDRSGPRRRGRRRRRPPHRCRSRPAARHPDQREGSDRRRRLPDHRGLAGPAVRRRRRRRGGGGAAARGRRGDRRQDQPARVRARPDQRGLGLRSAPSSARREPHDRRIERRIGGRGRRRPRLRQRRHRHRLLGPHPGRAVRRGRPEAALRRRADRRRRGRSAGASITSARSRAAWPTRGCSTR